MTAKEPPWKQNILSVMVNVIHSHEFNVKSQYKQTNNQTNKQTNKIRKNEKRKKKRKTEYTLKNVYFKYVYTLYGLTPLRLNVN